jgi:hypothetical protein
VFENAGGKVQDAGCRIQDLRCKIRDERFRIKDTGFKMLKPLNLESGILNSVTHAPSPSTTRCKMHRNPESI